MINIKLHYIKKRISTIEIKGHAGYAKSGKDIVCASVSTLLISSVNNINAIDDSFLDYKETDGYAKIICKSDNDTCYIIIDNMITAFYDLQKDYSKYISIFKKEE